MNAVQSRPEAMPADGARRPSESAVARLLIRAGQGPRGGKAADLKGLWQRMLGGGAPARPHADPGRLQIEVEARPGRQLFVLRDPEGTVDLSLGPGTYDITVVHGSRRRRYTVPLDPGATFDLDLHQASQGL